MKVKKTSLKIISILAIIVIVALFGFNVWNNYVLVNVGNLRSFSFSLLIIFSFIAGVVTFFAPCGLALLPAYLSYFLGLGENPKNPGLKKAMVTGAVVTLGIIALYSLLGFIISSIGVVVSPYITLLQYIFAVLIIILGIALLKNFSLNMTMFNKMFGQKIRQSSGFGRAFLFGIGYGIASVSCTFPVVMALIFVPLITGNFLVGVGVFLSYSIALGIMMIIMSGIIAYSKEDVLQRMLKSSVKIKKLSGIVMMFAGIILLIYYLFFGMVIK